MPRLLAIDLGTHAVKVTAFRGTGRTWTFDERYDVRVPQDGAPPTLESRLVALDALFSDRPNLKPTTSDAVALALPGGVSTFHRLTMPFTDRGKVEQTLPFAIEAEVPFDLDDMILGWRVLSQREQTVVLAALARKDQLEVWIGALAQRGLDPAVVDVDGELMAPFAAGADGGRGGPGASVAVVDIGHSHTSVSVVRGGQVEWTRSVNVGGWSFTRAIQQALQCSWADAEARKHGRLIAAAAPPGAEDETTDTIGTALQISPSEEQDPAESGYRMLPPQAREAMDGAIGLLLAEIRSTLIQAEDILSTSIDEVRVVGGGSRIPELWGYLQQDLGVTVSRPGLEVPASFALSHALGLQAAGQAGSPAIDLRLGQLAYRGGTDWVRAGVVYGGMGLGIFVLASVVLFGFRYWQLDREGDAADDQIRTIVGTTFPELPPATIEDTTTALSLMAEETEDAVNRAASLTQTGTPPTIDAWYALTEAFPAHPGVTVELSELSISADVISFTAETDGYASSAAVEESLQKDPRFKNATKGDETKTATGRVRFPISIPLGEVAAPADPDARTPSKTGKEAG